MPVNGLGWLPLAAALSIAGPGAYAQGSGGQAASLGALSREEVLRLPSVLQAAASDFGTPSCPQSDLTALAPGEKEVGTLVELQAEGVTALDATGLQKEWSSLIGAKISREALARVAARVECRYRERGFLFARASIRLIGVESDGRYAIAVTEGELKTLEALAPDPEIAALALRAFASVRKGDALNALDVRRGLAVAASLGLTDIRPTVRRSRTDPDMVDLVLVTGQPQNEVFAAINNYGADALGPWGGFVAVRGVGLLGGGERSSLGVFTSADGEEQIGAQASIEGLLNGQGLTGKLELAYAKARPGGDISVLDVRSKTSFLSASLSGPLSIRRGQVTYWRAGLESVDQETTFFGSTPLSTDRLRVAFFGLTADGLAGRSVWRASADVRKGLDAFGADSGGESLLSRADADPQAALLRVEGEVQTPLAAGYLLKTSLRAQHSGSGLSSFEEFNFGALNGGLGYDPGAVTGDSGVAFGASLEGPAYTLRENVTVRGVLQASGAQAWNEDQASRENPRAVMISGGLRFAVADTVNVDLLWAEPLRSSGVPDEARQGRIYVQLSAGANWVKDQLFGARKAK
jgi:hemolysin activation/secretion protein